MVVARCGACGSPLDLGAVEDGRVACGSCGSWTLFASATSTETVPLARLAALDEDALVAQARDWLARRGLPPPVDVALQVEPGVYATREARIEKGRGEVLFLFSSPP